MMANQRRQHLLCTIVMAVGKLQGRANPGVIQINETIPQDKETMLQSMRWPMINMA